MSFALLRCVYIYILSKAVVQKALMSSSHNILCLFVPRLHMSQEAKTILVYNSRVFFRSRAEKLRRDRISHGSALVAH